MSCILFAMPVAGTHFRQVPLVNNLDPPTKNASSYWSWTGCNIPSSYCCLEILFFLSLQRRSFLCQPMVVALMDRLAHGIVAMKRRPCLGENSARWAIDSMLKSTQMWTGKKMIALVSLDGLKVRGGQDYLFCRPFLYCIVHYLFTIPDGKFSTRMID